MLCLYSPSLQRRRILQEMSNRYCLPGRAGGSPDDVRGTGLGLCPWPPGFHGCRRSPRRSGSPSSPATIVLPCLNVRKSGAGRDGFGLPPGKGRSACGPISSSVGLCGRARGAPPAAAFAVTPNSPILRSMVVSGGRAAMRDPDRRVSAAQGCVLIMFRSVYAFL